MRRFSLFLIGSAFFAAPLVARAQSTAGDSAAVYFMQGMMHHHAQAIVMGHLVPTHTRNKALNTAAGRIVVSQSDEIALMRRWLEHRQMTVPAIDTSTPDTLSHAMSGMDMSGMNMSGMDMKPGAIHMPGMLTHAQLVKLARARGTTFDGLFLRFMIAHHEGALKMVADLFAVPGATNDPELFQLASDIDADQRAEIARMRSMSAAMQAPKKAHKR